MVHTGPLRWPGRRGLRERFTEVLR